MKTHNKRLFSLSLHFIKFVAVFAFIVFTGMGCDEIDDEENDGHTENKFIFTGTAATGTPVPEGTEIVAKDSHGQSVRTATSADGKFEVFIPVSFDPPFLLRTMVENRYMYGIACKRRTMAINIHPYTDLLVRCYCLASNTDPEMLFDDPPGEPIPGVGEVGNMKRIMTRFLALWLEKHRLSPDDFDFISTPFDADHTGFDSILDTTTIETAGEEISVSIGKAGDDTTQTTIITMAPYENEMIATTKINMPNGLIQFSDSTRVVNPVDETLLATTLKGINKTLDEYLSIIREKGAALTGEDLEILFHPDFLENQLTRDLVTAHLASELRGNALPEGYSHAIQIIEFDENNMVAEVILEKNGEFEGESGFYAGQYFKLAPDTEKWLFYGSQEDYGGEVAFGGTRIYAKGESTTATHCDACVWTFSQNPDRVTLSGPGLNGKQVLSLGEMETFDLFHAPDESLSLSKFSYETHTRVDELPEPGSEFTFTITDEGSTIELVRKIQAVATEVISGTTTLPTESPIGSVTGHEVTFTITLPTTFTAHDIEWGWNALNIEGHREKLQPDSETPTTMTCTFPTQVKNGEKIEAITRLMILARVKGKNGETTRVKWVYGES